MVWLCKTKPDSTYGEQSNFSERLQKLTCQNHGCSRSGSSLFRDIVLRATEGSIAFNYNPKLYEGLCCVVLNSGGGVTENVFSSSRYGKAGL
jgi:hypothetical protein